ncbi:MFS transporter [Bradyrhizobium sp.]|uniref:MFS transporter n=1 Tax=Bradyrhizobium sp. TaxID=376 RepID=UPI003C707E28
MDQTPVPASVEDSQRTSANAIAAAAIVVLICSYCVNAMDRTLFPLMLTDVRREYGFTLPQAGLMSTFFTLGMTLAGIPTGYLMSRYSRKTVIQVGILIYSAATIITVAASGFADMLLYRAITGIGEAMQLTALLAVFSSYFMRRNGLDKDRGDYEIVRAGGMDIDRLHAVGGFIEPGDRTAVTASPRDGLREVRSSAVPCAGIFRR